MWRGTVPALDVRAWRDEFRGWREERRVRVAQERLKGEARVLDLADRMRRNGGAAPHRLHHECVQAFRRGEIEYDAVTPLYKHAMIHAGAIVPRDRPRFHTCPTCEAELGDGAAAG